MRRRDRITNGVLAGMVALNVAVCSGATWYYVRVDRRTASMVTDFESRLASAERTVADACGVALALAEREGGISNDDADGGQSQRRTEILGFGQTRSVGAIYPYIDIRDDYGDVRRTYLARIPFSEAKGGEGAPLVGADGVNPP